MTANPLMWQGGDPDAAYLDKVLRHGPVEVYFDEGVSFRTVCTLWLRATLAALPFLALSFVLVVISLSSLTSSRYGYGYGSQSSSSGVGTFGLICMLLAPIVWLIVFLVSRVAEPLGEWRVVLADRSTAADHVYSAIQGKLLERQLPLASMQTRRTATGFGAVQNRLILSDGQYRVYVSVFPFGTSLYLGWIMYRHRAGGELAGRFLVDLFASLSGRLDDIGRMLRTERPRALREVAHALCREGLNVAVQQIEVPLTYGFPNGLPPVEPLPGATHQPAYPQAVTGAWPAQQPGTPG